MHGFARPSAALFGAAAVTLLCTCGEERPPLASAGRDERSAELADADAARGRRLVSAHGCIACHTMPGVRGPASNVGPPLDGLARRAYLGGTLPNSPANLVRWLLDPPAVNPRTAMPNTGLAPAEAADIAAFLLARP
ncbi:Cytochrome c oxidase subunit 2 [Achromobacter veterisilvae]|uniref:Cytochrome c oxidase subunit 2 n=1 Tax=Achromobacter veterisilvae TaxID=2069367 RepID=A0A446CGW6_9BURK|nr:c-type cytochrome [Achromobacter veterisilvae]SSW67147.1 Cytochrome c oxidase subunit 2 [Achromobacter veterisilvae]